MKTAQFQLHAEMENRHWWFLARRKIVRDLARELLPPSPSALVVDVGCGTGGNLAGFAADYRCVGIDPSGEAIGLAQSRFPAAQFLQGPIPDGLGPLAGQAHLLLLMDVMEHVQDDVRFLSELLARMRPGACLLLTVPADPALWSQHDVSLGHYRRYTPVQLRAVWEGQPVRTLLFSHFNARLYPAVWVVRMLGRRRGVTYGCAETDFRLPPGPVNRLLYALFASEGPVLLDLMRKKRAGGFRRGVSMIAVLRKEEN